MPILKVAFSFSLALAAALALAQGYGQALDALDRPTPKSKGAFEALLAESEDDPVLSQRLSEHIDSPTEETARLLRQSLELRVLAQTPAPDAQRQGRIAREILDSGPYADPARRSKSNWLGRLLERLSGIDAGSEGPSAALGAAAGVGPWLITVVKVLLLAALAAFLFVAVRTFRWRGNLRRRATAILDEDEPERTPDEWWERAEDLAAQGRYREAVRCLYLASLLRLDEHAIARFDRHQTNWEHLRRIEAGGRLPEGIDFRAPTQAFDRVWYGNRLRGASDYEFFRDGYSELMRRLGGKAA